MKNIFQIYHDKDLIPSYVEDNIKNINMGYKYILINFEEGKEIVKKYFEDDELKNKIIDCIDRYPRYCHKSDLLRYCLLYIYGGYYIDVDLKPLVSFEDMMHKNIDFFTSFGRAGVSKMINNNVIYPVTSNGILFSKKGNPILIDLIRHSVTNENLLKGDSIYRGENVFYLYEYINRRCIEQSCKLEPFKILNIDNQNIYFFNHIIRRDKDVIVDKDNDLIIANDKDYVFKRQTSSSI